MKQVLLPIFGVIAFIAIVGFGLQRFEGGGFGNNPLPLVQKNELPEVRIGNSLIKVEIADTPSKRRVGLSNYKQLQEGQGMLFVFDKKLVPTFWMKDMDFAIDIIWINGDKIVGIDRDVRPEPGVPDYKLSKYSPNENVDYVLEVDSGFAERNNIGTGDSVVLP